MKMIMNEWHSVCLSARYWLSEDYHTVGEFSSCWWNLSKWHLFWLFYRRCVSTDVSWFDFMHYVREDRKNNHHATHLQLWLNTFYWKPWWFIPFSAKRRSWCYGTWWWAYCVINTMQMTQALKQRGVNADLEQSDDMLRRYRHWWWKVEGMGSMKGMAPEDVLLFGWSCRFMSDSQ